MRYINATVDTRIPSTLHLVLLPEQRTWTTNSKVPVSLGFPDVSDVPTSLITTRVRWRKIELRKRDIDYTAADEQLAEQRKTSVRTAACSNRGLCLDNPWEAARIHTHKEIRLKRLNSIYHTHTFPHSWTLTRWAPEVERTKHRKTDIMQSYECFGLLTWSYLTHDLQSFCSRSELLPVSASGAPPRAI